MKHTPGWPSHEAITAVTECYNTTPAAAIAAELGVSLTQVYRLAFALRLRKHPQPWGKETINEVRRLHADKLSDVEIAERMGLTRDKVHHIRFVKLKLLPNAEGIHRGQLRAVAKQRITLGIRHGGDLRAQAYRKYAAENGWPEDLRFREVQILNVLAATGVPMTRVEISEAIGARTDKRGKRAGGKTTPNLLPGNGPGGTYTATLIRRGLLIGLLNQGPQCKVAGKGCGRRLTLYSLGPAALAVLQERANACKTNATL